MSVELGKKISVIENANVTLLHKYFDEKRKKIDVFIQEEWVPIFAEEFFSNRSIASAWNQIVSANNKEERLKFIILTGPKLQERINRKRLELIKPLDDLERRIENKIRVEYNQARAINNSITSFSISASEVTETRSRYLQMMGVSEDKIGKIIEETDDAVSYLLKGAKDAQGRLNAAEEYIDKIKSIIKSI